MSFLDFPPKRNSQTDNINKTEIAHTEDDGEMDKSLTVSEKMKDMDKLLTKAKANDDIGYFNQDPNKRSRGSLLPLTQQDIVDKEKKKKRILIIVAIIAAAILILGLGLGLGLKSKDHPNPPPPPPPTHTNRTNPFYVSQVNASSTGVQTYVLTKDPTVDPLNSNYAQETQSNKFINQIVLKASLAQQGAVRMQFGAPSDPQSAADYQAQTDALFGQQDLISDQLSMNQIGFAVETSAPPQLGASLQDDDKKTAFSWKIYDKNSLKEYVNTKDHVFYAMTHYLELGFTLSCRGIAGLGERNSDLLLKDGTYTLFPQVYNLTDPGKAGHQGQGSHPFIMCQQPDLTFMGVFIYNTNPMDIDISSEERLSIVNVTVRAVGGIIDLFVFQGPGYSDVIKQYQQIIGKPKLPPYWAHGYHARAAFADVKTVQNALQAYQKVNLPLESIGLTNAALTNGENLNLIIDLAKAKEGFPKVKFLLPFSYFVPTTAVDQTKSLNLLKAFVTVNKGLELQVLMGDSYEGHCIDFFNPESATYVQQLLTSLKFDPAFHGFWLDNNTPYITSTNAQDTPTNDPFYYLTYIPGNVSLSSTSLPTFAEHSSLSIADNKNYHLDQHALFGTVMAKQIKAASNKLQSASVGAPIKQTLVISDSTYPGAGQLGIVHIFPQNNGTWEDLRQTFTNLLNFNLFGIPNVGANICGHYSAEDKELCQRYYQLAIISPIAMHNQDSFTDVVEGIFADILPSVQMSLQRRNQLMLYMRTSLYRIWKEGGSLLRPIFADYPLMKIYDQMGESVLYGEHLLVHLSLTKGQNKKTVLFPGKEWLNLDTFQVVKVDDVKPNIQNLDTSPESPLNIFQKGNGTIIPLIDTKRHAIMNTDDAFSSPFMLSIYLDDTLYSQAQGFVQVDVPESQRKMTNAYRFFDVRARNGIISFQKQSNATMQEALPLEKIILTNAQYQINASCALMNDFWSTVPLYVSAWDPVNKQAIITTYDPTNAKDTTTIDVSQVAFIFYGQLPVGTKCGQNLFQMTEAEVYQKDDKTYYARLTQNLQQLLGRVVFDVYLNITLLTDNSVYFHYGVTKYPSFKTPTEVYDRNFTKQSGYVKTVKLGDILTVNSSPFFFSIHTPASDKSALTYFTTEHASNFFHYDMNLFSISLPGSQGFADQFFGLGERSGAFFLKDDTTYALNNNDNNVPDQMGPTKTSSVEFGRNGFFPVIFGRTGTKDQKLMTGMWTVSSVSQQFVYRQQSSQGNSPQISILQTKSTLEQVFFFGLDAESTSKALFDHVQLGSLYTKPHKFIVPPPEWTFGQFFTLDGIDSEKAFDDKVKFIQDLGYPIEGFVMEENQLSNYDSFTFHDNFTTNSENWLLKKIAAFNGALIQISKTGLPTQRENNYTKMAQDGQYVILRPKTIDFINYTQSFFIGKDVRGEVCYADYSNPNVQNMITKMTTDLKTQIGKNNINFGVQLIDNEINNQFCNGDCKTDDQLSVNKGQLLNVGNEDFMSHSLSMEALRNIGNELYLHNLNALLEQIQYSQNPDYEYSFIPVISKSSSIGSGALGFVGRIFEEEDYTNNLDDPFAISTMQSQSIMGMNMLGLEITVTSADTDQQVILKQVMNAFTPLSIFDFKDNNNRYTSQILHKIRYMMVKYTRTQLMYSQNRGSPLMKPLFFSDIDNTDARSVVNSQFMYGPSVFVSINQDVKGSYFPKGLYVAPSYLWYHFKFSAGVVESKGEYKTDKNFYAFLVQGRITPLQDPFGDHENKNGVRVAADLEKVPLDLHIHVDLDAPGDVYAQGYLLIDGKNNIKGDAFCMANFKMYKANSTMEVLQISSKDPVSTKDVCGSYPGFTMGMVFVYNNKDVLKFQNIKVNGQDKVISILPGPTENYSIFDLRDMKLHITDLTKITFGM